MPVESENKELTDEETFRQVVEGFAQVRPEDKQRKMPRFPTPGVLSARLGVNGVEGNLVLEDFDFDDGPTSQSEDHPRKENGKDRSLGVNIVDFCEAGIQLQFQCDDIFRLKESLLYLELHDQRFPVTMVWFQKSGSFSRAGFSFNTTVHSDLFLARFISILNAELVDFLLSGYRRNPTALTPQAAVFTYLSIYYGLRLRFMETVAEANTLASLSLPDSPSGEFQDACSLPYTNTYNVEQLSRHKSDPRVRKLLYQDIRPFYEFGCGIVGPGHKVIFLKEDALGTIFNSALTAPEDCRLSPEVSPGLSSLYQNFLDLKQLIPGILDEVDLDAQFRYYSSIIYRVERFSEMFLALPPTFAENRELLDIYPM